MFKVEFFRYIKNPLNLIYSLLIPIVLLIIFGTANVEEPANIIQTIFMSLILFSSLGITIIPISLNLCNDKVQKRIKHYLIIDGGMRKYFTSIFLTNIIIFELVTIIIILIATIAFSVHVSTPNIFMLIFAPIISFTTAFAIAVIIGTYAKSQAVAIPLSLVVFYLLFLMTGVIPFQFLFAEYYYVQVLTIQGIIIMFYNYFAETITLTTAQLVVAGLLLCVYSVGLVTAGNFVGLKKIRAQQ